MLGSAVPPCFTITFDGGQFVGAPAVAGAEAFTAAAGSDGAGFGEVELDAAWPPVTGMQLELEGTVFFLCRFGAVCAFGPEGAFAGGAAEGACDVLGVCGGASCVSAVLEAWLAGAAL